jgi:hypothetical protein
MAALLLVLGLAGVVLAAVAVLFFLANVGVDVWLWIWRHWL